MSSSFSHVASKDVALLDECHRRIGSILVVTKKQLNVDNGKPTSSDKT
jgi:hypothetical protein